MAAILLEDPPLNIIGIRKEDKNRWERRAPLTPDHVSELARAHGVDFIVQPSARRVFHDLDYERAGAKLSLELDSARVILGVKEIPPERILADKTYLIFPHVTKGQSWNMPMLRKFVESGCTLIDYELIAGAERGERLIFFGRHAGYAGMLDTLWALGRRLAHEGFITPFEQLRMAHQYSSLDEALRDVVRVGEQIRHQGLPSGLRPIVFAFTGSGNVTQGALEVFGRLPHLTIEPEKLTELPEDRDRPRNVLYQTVITRSHRYERTDGAPFDAEDFVRDPGAYRSALGPLLPHVTVLVNGMYWEPGQPRLVSREMLVSLFEGEEQPKLRLIGDITCDIDGSIEATVRAADPGDPIYLYDPERATTTPGAAGRGVVVLAVDNLPCELPLESSQHFGDSLARFVPALARCDWTRPLDELEIPEEIRRAILLHRGELAPAWRGLAAHLEEQASAR